jgi:hypothetical protein
MNEYQILVKSRPVETNKPTKEKEKGFWSFLSLFRQPTTQKDVC